MKENCFGTLIYFIYFCLFLQMFICEYRLILDVLNAQATTDIGTKITLTSSAVQDQVQNMAIRNGDVNKECN